MTKYVDIHALYRREKRAKGPRSPRTIKRRTWGYRCTEDGLMILSMHWRSGPTAYVYTGMLTDYELATFVLGARALIALMWREIRRKARNGA